MPESGGYSDMGKRISNIRGSQPRLAALDSPFQRKGRECGGFECIYPSFLWKEVPAGRRLGAQSGVKDDVRLSIFLGKHGFNRCQILLLNFYV